MKREIQRAASRHYLVVALLWLNLAAECRENIHVFILFAVSGLVNLALSVAAMLSQPKKEFVPQQPERHS